MNLPLCQNPVKMKKLSWPLINNNDVEVKYVKIKLYFHKFSASSSNGAITIFCKYIEKSTNYGHCHLFFCDIWDGVGLRTAHFAQL